MICGLSCASLWVAMDHSTSLSAVWQATNFDVRWIVSEDFTVSTALSRIAQQGKPVEVTADYMGAFEETALSVTDALDSIFDTEV
ncbi:MAG: hypothetical protein HRT36_06950 [Alphaproteobacteria bacterium]|nr:hypothetical protein [Alphaproteobacteria bacterium]